MIEGLKFDVGLNAKNFNSGLKSMSNSLKNFESGLNRLKRTVLGLVSAYASFATIKKSISLFAEQESATLKLAFATQRFTKNARETFNAINDLANSLQASIGVGNEYTQNLAAIGLSYGIMEEKISKATEASIILSKVIGTDAQTIMRGFAQTLQGQLGIFGRYIPELRNLSEEQLRSGQAIDYVVNRFSGLKEALGQTTQANLDKIKSYLGDIGEYLGAIFAPAVKKTADIVKWFANALTDPQQALAEIKRKLVDFYQNLSPIAKGILAVVGGFLAFKVAVGAWNLLTTAVKLGGTAMIGIFKAVFSWPFLLAMAASVVYVAWEKNWFGIRDVVKGVWEKIKPIFETVWDFANKSWHLAVDFTLNLWDNLKRGFGWVWDNIIQPLSHGLINFVDKTWNFIVKVGENLGVGFMWLWDNILTPLAEGAIEFGGKVWNFLVNVSDNIGKGLIWLYENVIQPLVNGVWDGLQTVWNFTIDLAENIGKGFEWFWANILKPLGNGVWQTLKSAWDFTVNVIVPETIKGLTWLYENILVPLAGKVWDTLKATWDFTVNVLVPGIKGGLIWLYDNILKPLGEKTWDALKTVWSITVETAKGIGRGLTWLYENIIKPYWIPTIKTVWNITVEFTKDFADAVKNIIENIKQGNWGEIGKEIGRIIGEGITSSLNIGSVIAESIANTFIRLREGLQPAKEGLKEALKSAWVEALQVGTQEGTEGIDWSGVWASFKEMAKSLGASEIWASMIAFGMNIGKAIKEGILLVVDLAEIIGMAIGVITLEFYNKVIKPFGQSIGNAIGEGVKLAIDFVGWLGEKIAETWEGIKQKGSELAQAFIEGIKEVLSKFNPLNYLFWKPSIKLPPLNELPATGGGGGGYPFILTPWERTPWVNKQSGGFTLPIDTDKVAGVVHGGEWVAPAWMVRKYKDIITLLERIRQRGYQTGGYVLSGAGNITVGMGSWWNLDLSAKLESMMRDYMEVWGRNIDVIMSWLNNLGQTMGIQLPDEVLKSLEALNNMESQFDVLAKQLDPVKKQIKELGQTATETSKSLSQSTQVANSALQALANNIEWLSYSNGGLQLDLGAGVGNFINILLSGLASAFPIVNWILNPFSALANFIVGMLTHRNRQPEITEPEEPTTYGQTFVAGTAREVVYNFNVTFKENVLLTDDERAVKTLMDAIVQYVKDHGGVEVVFG